MNSTINAIMGDWLESTPDTAEQSNADCFLRNVLLQNHSADFTDHVMEILAAALYSEKRAAFSAGLKAGMEIEAFAMKGA